MGKRFTKEQERAIIDAYRDWDSELESVSELCQRLAISRQGLYQVLARNGVPLKGLAGVVVSSGDMIAKEMAAQALRVMIEDLTNSRRRVAELEAHVAQLEAMLEAARKRQSGTGRSSG